MGRLEVEFEELIPRIRAKKAAAELLKFKYEAFKRNAKLGALRREVGVGDCRSTRKNWETS